MDFISTINERLRNPFPQLIKNEIDKETKQYVKGKIDKATKKYVQSYESLPVPPSTKIVLDTIYPDRDECHSCEEIERVCKDFVSKGLFVRHGHNISQEDDSDDNDTYDTMEICLYVYKTREFYLESFEPLTITIKQIPCNSFTFKISFPKKFYDGEEELHRIDDNGNEMTPITITE